MTSEDMSRLRSCLNLTHLELGFYPSTRGLGFVSGDPSSIPGGTLCLSLQSQVKPLRKNAFQLEGQSCSIIEAEIPPSQSCPLGLQTLNIELKHGADILFAWFLSLTVSPQIKSLTLLDPEDWDWDNPTADALVSYFQRFGGGLRFLAIWPHRASFNEPSGILKYATSLRHLKVYCHPGSSVLTMLYALPSANLVTLAIELHVDLDKGRVDTDSNMDRVPYALIDEALAHPRFHSLKSFSLGWTDGCSWCIRSSKVWLAIISCSFGFLILWPLASYRGIAFRRPPSSFDLIYFDLRINTPLDLSFALNPAFSTLFPINVLPSCYTPHQQNRKSFCPGFSPFPPAFRTFSSFHLFFFAKDVEQSLIPNISIALAFSVSVLASTLAFVTHTCVHIGFNIAIISSFGLFLLLYHPRVLSAIADGRNATKRLSNLFPSKVLTEVPSTITIWFFRIPLCTSSFRSPLSLPQTGSGQSKTAAFVRTSNDTVRQVLERGRSESNNGVCPRAYCLQEQEIHPSRQGGLLVLDSAVAMPNISQINSGGTRRTGETAARCSRKCSATVEWLSKGISTGFVSTQGEEKPERQLRFD
ncbi:hypothetical protein C8R45DRAFT_930602 [Mycena sanguinolenta]|nr:hypothetical protein C8R45DRAFT_930602 [Mycena sanguinolenta]